MEYIEELFGGSPVEVVRGLTLKDWLFYAAVVGLLAGVVILWTSP